MLIIMCLGLMFGSFTPPTAPISPHVFHEHGKTRKDDYHWLKDREDPRVKAYLEAENAYAERVLGSAKELQKELYHEMLERIPQNDVTVPEKRGHFFYYTRFEEGKAYPLHCRKGIFQDREEIYLDENEFSSDHFFSLGIISMSPNHELVAVNTDTTGDEFFTLKIKDLKTNSFLLEKIYPQSGNVIWANDNKTLFYTTVDATKRTNKVYRHELFSDPKHDVLVFEEKDPRFFLTLKKSKDGKMLFLRSKSHVTSVAYYLNADTPNDAFQVMIPRKEGVKYYVEHHGNQFFVLTNENAPNFKLISFEVGKGEKESQLWALSDRDVYFEKIEMFEKYVVIHKRTQGLPGIDVISFADGQKVEVPFSEKAYCITRSNNPDFHAMHLRFHYSSLVTPPSVYDYEMDTHVLQLKKRQEVASYDSSLFVTDRIFASAPDGEKIPISLVHKKDLQKNGLSPCLLTGYGAYGCCVGVGFSGEIVSLLDRGFIYGIAHIRGGGELGQRWVDGGKMSKKKNTFTDFISCLEHLIEEGYTSSDRLVIEGGSAGGLLMGAVANWRPELVKAIVARVPFVDVISSMGDPSLPYTANEYEEWGNPANLIEYEYMLSYSPYDNVSKQKYPSLLISGGFHDTRVGYWEPAKWTAKLRALKTDSNPLFLKTNMKGGHFGSSGRYNALKEEAFTTTFILEAVKKVD